MDAAGGNHKIIADRKLLDPMPALEAMPSTAEIKEWLLGKRPPFCVTDDIVESDLVHPQVQRLLNFEHRIRAAWVSPDLRDQIHFIDGTSTPASFPQHGPRNVRGVPLAFNLLKRTSLEEVALFTCVSLFEMNQEDGFQVDVDGIAGLMIWFAAPDVASCQPKYLTPGQKTGVMSEVESRRAWL